MNIENQNFDFGEQGKMPFFRGTREQVSPWEGLNKDLDINKMYNCGDLHSFIIQMFIN